MKEKHISVLLEESISSLNLKENSIIVDCTLGYGGHSSNILARIKKGFLFAFDQDSEAIRHSTDRLNAVGTNFTIIKSNFVHLKEKLNELGVEKVDGVIVAIREYYCVHEQLEKAISALKFAEARILGFILNDSKGNGKTYKYRYRYSYRYNYRKGYSGYDYYDNYSDYTY